MEYREKGNRIHYGLDSNCSDRNLETLHHQIIICNTDQCPTPLNIELNLNAKRGDALYGTLIRIFSQRCRAE